MCSSVSKIVEIVKIVILINYVQLQLPYYITCSAVCVSWLKPCVVDDTVAGVLVT